jgi:hypothetical protein
MVVLHFKCELAKQTMRYAKLSPDSGRNFVNDLYK